MPRAAPGGYVYHALNRAVARLPLFEKDGDFDAFERALVEAHHEHPTRLLAYRLMPNHWHFVVWPAADWELTAFLRWLTHMHTQRWHAHYHTAGRKVVSFLVWARGATPNCVGRHARLDCNRGQRRRAASSIGMASRRNGDTLRNF